MGSTDEDVSGATSGACGVWGEVYGVTATVQGNKYYALNGANFGGGCLIVSWTALVWMGEVAEGTYAVLSTKGIQAIFDRKTFCLQVNVSLEGTFVAVSGDPQSRASDVL